ncbi:MAG: hypothetical protein ACAI44_09170 [Candidatus Sericytochromatia bacterium]
MKRATNILLLAVLGLSGSFGCSLPGGQTPQTSAQTSADTVLADDPQSVADFRIKVKESFAVKAVDEEHKEAVEAARKAFEADLQQGKVDSYYQLPSFSVLLAAGSEGSFFKSEEIAKIEKTGAVFAMAVIYNPAPPPPPPGAAPPPGPPPANPQVFRGQLSNQRFHFAGKYLITPENTAYLITLNSNLQTQILKGQLAAGSEGSFFTPPAQLVAGSEGSFISSLPLPEPVSVEELKAQASRFQKALDSHQSEGEAFRRKVSQLKFVRPDTGAPITRTELFARMIHAYPEELGYEFTLLQGLPPDIHGTRVTELLNLYRARYIRDCGSAPPDSDKLTAPQFEAAESPIPEGYQNPELEAIIKAIPEFADELEKVRFGPVVTRYRRFLALLSQFQASHPQVFKDKGYKDAYLAPDCVRR